MSNWKVLNDGTILHLGRRVAKVPDQMGDRFIDYIDELRDTTPEWLAGSADEVDALERELEDVKADLEIVEGQLEELQDKHSELKSAVWFAEDELSAMMDALPDDLQERIQKVLQRLREAAYA